MILLCQFVLLCVFVCLVCVIMKRFDLLPSGLAEADHTVSRVSVIRLSDVTTRWQFNTVIFLSVY